MPARREPQGRSRLRVIAAAALFSTGGAAIKATSLAGLQIACLRSGIAVIALALMIPAARRGWTLPTLLIGAAYAATMILFVQANKLTTAASTIFLQSTAPLYILLLGPWLLREPVRRRDLIFLLTLAGGMALFFIGLDAPAPTAPRPLAGNLAGALAGLTWALTLVGLRWTARSHDDRLPGDAAASVVLAGNLIAFLACLPALVPLPAMTRLDGGLAIYLGVFQIGLAYVFLTKGLRQVGALAASLLLLVEPALNPVWAWIVHGEVPGLLSLAGGTIILAATALRTRADMQGTRGAVVETP